MYDRSLWLALLVAALTACATPVAGAPSDVGAETDGDPDGKGDSAGDGSGRTGDRSDPEGPGGAGGATDPAAPTYESVEVDARGFVVDGRRRLLRGGSVQWFRIAEEAWEDRLRRFRAAGFNTVDVYVPWNVIEPEEGAFQFEEPDLRRFLGLCQQLGLYVYLRPGPYITNEMDGGGVPAWVFERTTKRERGEDGRMNLRTRDPEYLEAVGRYFDALNEVIRPYLVTNGGPIVLYSIENEYDWFETFFRLDKLFTLEGRAERGTWQEPDTRGYLAALRDRVRAAGVDVPITTCPGSAQVAGMGDVEGVIPMPNVYPAARTEGIAYDVVTSMHDPERFGGAYVGYPSGSTETERTAARLNRLVLGGMDASFHFNVVGMSTPGYQNSLVLYNTAFGQDGFQARGLGSIFELTPENVVTGFVSPTVGYFHNVVDYYGAVGPSGVLRSKLHDFRRANLFLDSFEADIAWVLHPERGGPGAPDGSDHVAIDHPAIGALEEGGRVHYWLRGRDGTHYVGLTNETGSAQRLAPGSIRIGELALPVHTVLTVSPTDYPGADAPPTEVESARFLVAEHPLEEGATLRYVTSQILALRDFGDDELMVVYGVRGTEGELRIDGVGEPEHVGAGITVHATGTRLEASWVHGAPAQLVIPLPSGRRLRVLVVDREMAGRVWFPFVPGEGVMLAGIDYVASVTGSGDALTLSYEHRARDVEVLALSTHPLSLDGFETVSPHHPATQMAIFRRSAPEAIPEVGDLLSRGVSRTDHAEADPGFDDSGWTAITGDPRPLEELGIHGGHAWYRAEFDLDRDPDSRWLGYRLWVDHASDIVGIYVNGHYVNTVSPVGTEIDGRSVNASYRFPELSRWLRRGRNVIAFRVEVWGHGSFMWPRGTLIGTNLRLPSLGFDSVKGLWGRAEVGDIRLTRWRVRGGLGGERRGLAERDHGDEWAAARIPLALGRGEVRWYQTSFRTSDLPDPERFHAPVVLSLSGRDAKATLFVNGRLVGRWLSDEEWLSRGSWGRAKRDMWMNTLPDDFPIPAEMLRAAGENLVTIAFEDTSGPDEATGGRIDRLELRHAREERARVAGETRLVPTPTHRGRVTVRRVE